jgi:HEAT repeat protein
METAWQAEELLHWLAGPNSPDQNLGSGQPESRKSCADAWSAWWQSHGHKLDLSQAADFPRQPGLVLICENDSASHSSTGRVYIAGCDGTHRWELRNPLPLTDAYLLSGDRVMLAQRSANGLTERNLAGKINREYAVNNPVHFQLHAERLTALSRNPYTVYRFASTGDLLFRKDLEFDEIGRFVCQVKVGRVLANGRLQLLVFVPRKAPNIFVEETDPGSGKTHWRIPVRKPLGYLPGVDEMRDGHVSLIQPVVAGERILEVNCVGETVRSYPLPAITVSSVARLRTGDLLVAGKEESRFGCIMETDRQGRIKWEVLARGEFVSVRSLFPILRLGFQDFRSSDWDLASMVNRAKNLKSKDALVRYRSIAALRKHQPSDVVPQVLNALDDPDDDVRRMSMELLVGLGPQSLPSLKAALADTRGNVRIQVLHCFAELSKSADKYIPDITKLLKDRQWEVRFAAARTLGAFGPKAIEAVPDLMAALKDSHREVVMAAALSLGSIGPGAGRATDSLVKIIRSNDVDLQKAAIAAIGEIGPSAKEAVPALVRLLESNDFQGIHSAVASALGGIGSDAGNAVPSLIKLLRSDDHLARQSAAIALGRIGPAASAAVSALTDAANESNGPIREEAVAALGKIGPKARTALPTLRKIVEESRGGALGQIAQQAIRKIERSR